MCGAVSTESITQVLRTLAVKIVRLRTLDTTVLPTFRVYTGFFTGMITADHYLNTAKESDQTLFKYKWMSQMSAIKTHETFQIVHGDDIQCQNEEGEDKQLRVKSLVISRQKPSLCQIFTVKENTGSLQSSETKVYHGKIETIAPGAVTTEFVVKARVGEEFQNLNLKCQRSESSDCCIC